MQSLASTMHNLPTQYAVVLIGYFELRCTGTLSGEVTLAFTYLLPVTRQVYSQRKEFAPLGANFFSLRVNPSSEGLFS